jgi:hypothetical protein
VSWDRTRGVLVASACPASRLGATAITCPVPVAHLTTCHDTRSATGTPVAGVTLLAINAGVLPITSAGVGGSAGAGTTTTGPLSASRSRASGATPAAVACTYVRSSAFSMSTTISTVRQLAVGALGNHRLATVKGAKQERCTEYPGGQQCPLLGPVDPLI